jgi:N-acetylglutamate synthase-like GNAT family acetyltransferase
MNVALASGRLTPDLLDRIRTFFREQGLPTRIESLSGEPPGFVPAGELFVLFILAGAPVPAPPEVTVRRADRSTFSKFADLYVAAFGRPDILRSDLDGWIGLENWRFYTAEVEGRPAGAAMLSLHGEAAYLASAATRPEMRGHGVHAALLRRRMEDAAEAGCSIVFARAAPGGAGASGLMRAGLQLSHRKRIWVEAR